MTDLPAPMTASDCDLRGMPYMPLDVIRLFDSDFYILCTGDEFKAAVTLWGKAFLQVPAASLPDNDRILAHLSGAGAAWPAVKAMALHGWVKCADGRLYHPTVAEKANAAWEQRQAHRSRTEAATAARAAKRDATKTDNANVTNDTEQNVTNNVTSNVTENVASTKGEGRESEGKDREEPSPSAQSARTGARGTRLPVDWQPSAEDRAYAEEMGLDCRRVAEDFRGYWLAKAGKDAVKVDWSLTWQGWCRRELDRRGAARPGAPPSAPKPTAMDRRLQDMGLIRGDGLFRTTIDGDVA